MSDNPIEPTRKQTIMLARKAGILVGKVPRIGGYVTDLERFAAIVAEWGAKKGAKREREDCAMLCEELAHNFRNQKRGDFDTRYDWLEDAAMDCADAINNRGKVKS